MILVRLHVDLFVIYILRSLTRILVFGNSDLPKIVSVRMDQAQDFYAAAIPQKEGGSAVTYPFDHVPAFLSSLMITFPLTTSYPHNVVSN